MLLTKEKIYAILHFLVSIKRLYVGSLSRYDTSVLSHSKKYFENTLSLILHCYIYLLQKAAKKDFVFKKIRFLVKTQGSLTAKHR